MKISKLQYITQDSDKYPHAEQARIMFENGINWVQIRMKNDLDSEIIKQSKKALQYANKYHAKLIINDSIEITKEIGAHGVHLGLKDRSIEEAREYLGQNFIIGGTANTFEDVEIQISKGADYIGLGPFRFTSTKQKLSPIIGLEGYKNLYKNLKEHGFTTPIVAVGGIEIDDIEQLIAVGLHGVAISTALLNKYGN